MRIVITHPAATPLTYNMVTSLQSRGHDVTFYTGFYYKPRLRSFLRRIPGRIGSHLEREFGRRWHRGIDPDKVHLLDWHRELARIASCRPRISTSIPRRLWNAHCAKLDLLAGNRIKVDRPDIVIGHDDSCLFTHRVARTLGIPAVLNQVTGHSLIASRILDEERSINEDFSEDLTLHPADRVTERKRREPLQADYILSPSRYVEKTLLEIGVPQDHIVYLPYGVELDRFSPRFVSPRPFRVLFVGRIWQRKGIKYLLEAFRRLRLDNAELILLGSLGCDKALEDYRSIFTHINSVPHSEVEGYYASANVFVYPSLHEGSALAIFEALASGVPVITTPNAGSVVRDGLDGYIVPIRDVEAIMDRIRRLYDSQELRDGMAKSARLRSQEYSWDAYGDNLEAILERILGSEPVTPRNTPNLPRLNAEVSAAY